MCVIVFKPPGKKLDMLELRACEEEFRDGIGFVSFNPGTKKITRAKTEKDIEKLLEKWNKIKNKEDHTTIIHFRKASMGDVSRRNIQPLQNEKYYYAHNGTMRDLEKYARKGQSDSHVLGQRFLPVLDMGNDAHNEIFEKFVHPSRVIVMDKETGKVTLFNEGGGNWRGGIWYSNLRWTNNIWRLRQAENKSQGDQERERRVGSPESLYLSTQEEASAQAQMSILPLPKPKVKDATGRNVEPKYTIPYSGPGRPFDEIHALWVWKNDTIYHQASNKHYHYKDYPIPEVRETVAKWLEGTGSALKSSRKRKFCNMRARYGLPFESEAAIISQRIKALSFITREDGLCWKCLSPTMQASRTFADEAECQHCKWSAMLKTYGKL